MRSAFHFRQSKEFWHLLSSSPCSRIKRLVGEAEEAGTRGDVDQAQDLMILCDNLKEEREALLKSHDNSHWAGDGQEKLMEVCEVCGAFLIIGDAQQRIEDHLTGKQHLGYAKLRRAVEELYERRRKRNGCEVDGGGGSRGSGGERRRGAQDGDRKTFRNGGDADRRNRFDRRDRDSFYGRGDRHDRNNHRQRNRDRGQNNTKGLSESLDLTFVYHQQVMATDDAAVAAVRDEEEGRSRRRNTQSY